MTNEVRSSRSWSMFSCTAPLGLRVERARRLVEDQDAEAEGTEPARSRRAGAVLPTGGSPSRRCASRSRGAGVDEVMGVGHPCRALHALEVRRILAERDVAGDGVVEQIRLLEHEADPRRSSRYSSVVRSTPS